MLNRALLTTAIGLALPLFVGCGAGTSSVSVHAAGDDVVRQALGEVDVTQFESVVVHVVSVRMRIAEEDGGEGNEEGSWHDLDLQLEEGQDYVPLDLVKLTTGESFYVAAGEVPSGVVTQIRLVLAEDQGEALYTDGTEAQVRVPSGSQSGLKLSGAAVELVENEEHDFRLEFDAEASIHPENDGTVRVQPVIHIAGVTSTQDDDHDPETVD